MALDITVSGPDADSYRTTAELVTYATGMGFEVTATEAKQEASLRRSALFLDTSWDWLDELADEAQSMAHPRGEYTTIHKSIGDAQCELALRILDGVDIFAEATGRQIKSESVKVEGAIVEGFTYEGGGAGGGAARAFPEVDALVRRWAKGLATPSGGADSASIGITK